jgi:hypothetical protein
VRRADARSAQIGDPDSVAQRLQVSTNSSDPFEPKAARNLLSKDRCRAALRDEASELGPEVAGVGVAPPISGMAVGLARAGPGPNRSPWRPPGEAKRLGPTADPREQVDLLIAGQVLFLEPADIAAVDGPGRDVPRVAEPTEPGRRVAVVFVVEGSHQHSKRICRWVSG